MKVFLKNFFNLLIIVYFAQVLVCLFVDDEDAWSRWISLDFHLGAWIACLIVSAIGKMYDRITKK